MKMKEGDIEFVNNDDANASERKNDHIALAFNAQVSGINLDPRFYYEPLLSSHPGSETKASFTLNFLGKEMKFPIWVSSMTGGTALAMKINHNLARMCREFGFGMGLGSCRSLLYSNDRFSDFDMRDIIGDQPLLANLGICQLEELIQKKDLHRVSDLLEKLRVDGLIIHVNPLQEWLQPEGDKLTKAPLETIMHCLEQLSTDIIVKEVGQGFGPESMRTLLRLPIAAIDFAANGGTNFSKLELLRSNSEKRESYQSLSYIGHSAEEMVNFLNKIVSEESEIRCKQVIISGGVKSFLDGYYLIEKVNFPAIYGQASAFLKNAVESYEDLCEYASIQIEGLSLAKSYLKVR